MRFTDTRSRYVPIGATKVADKQSDAVAYIYTNDKGQPCARVFYGKQTKPVLYCYFLTTEGREATVRRYFDNRRATAARKAAAAAENKARLAEGHGLEVGHVLSSSWGYEQTNVNFYQVTALVGRTMVQLRPIGSISAGEVDMSGKVLPAADRFTGEPIRRKVTARDTVRIDDVRLARVWDGRPLYFSSYH